MQATHMEAIYYGCCCEKKVKEEKGNVVEHQEAS